MHVSLQSSSLKVSTFYAPDYAYIIPRKTDVKRKNRNVYQRNGLFKLTKNAPARWCLRSPETEGKPHKGPVRKDGERDENSDGRQPRIAVSCCSPSTRSPHRGPGSPGFSVADLVTRHNRVCSQQNQRRTQERCGPRGHAGGLPGAGKLRERKERPGHWEPSQPTFQPSCLLLRANRTQQLPACTQAGHGGGHTRPGAQNERVSTALPSQGRGGGEGH